MKIKIKETVNDYENKPIEVGPDKEKLTLFDVFVNALNSQVPGEQLTAETKNKIYQITKKLYSSNEPNFTPDQLVIIKERVGKTYAPMVYGKILELIDGVDESAPAAAPETPPSEAEQKPTN